MKVSFVIPGPPVAWRAARSYRIPGTNKIGHYAENAAHQWKAKVALVAAGAMWEKERFEGPVAVHLMFAVERPPSRPKKYAYADKRPDLPNLTKGTLDALEKIVFRNDAQICSLIEEKVYAEAGPYTEIIVEDLEDEV